MSTPSPGAPAAAARPRCATTRPRLSSVQPVVPTTACTPASISAWTFASVAEGTVKSTATSAPPSVEAATSSPASRRATSSRSAAPSTAAQTVAPMRPAAPSTATRSGREAPCGPGPGAVSEGSGAVVLCSLTPVTLSGAVRGPARRPGSRRPGSTTPGQHDAGRPPEGGRPAGGRSVAERADAHDRARPRRELARELADVVGGHGPDRVERLLEAQELAVDELRLAEAAHARARVLEAEDEAARELADAAVQLGLRDAVVREAVELAVQERGDLVDLRRRAAGVEAERADAAVPGREGVRRVGEAALLADPLEEARAHAAAERRAEHREDEAPVVRRREARAADHDVRLLDRAADREL